MDMHTSMSSVQLCEILGWADLITSLEPQLQTEPPHSPVTLPQARVSRTEVGLSLSVPTLLRLAAVCTAAPALLHPTSLHVIFVIESVFQNKADCFPSFYSCTVTEKAAENQYIVVSWPLLMASIGPQADDAQLA